MVESWALEYYSIIPILRVRMVFAVDIDHEFPTQLSSSYLF